MFSDIKQQVFFEVVLKLYQNEIISLENELCNNWIPVLDYFINKHGINSRVRTQHFGVSPNFVLRM